MHKFCAFSRRKNPSRRAPIAVPQGGRCRFFDRTRPVRKTLPTPPPPRFHPRIACPAPRQPHRVSPETAPIPAPTSSCPRRRASTAVAPRSEYRAVTPSGHRRRTHGPPVEPGVTMLLEEGWARVLWAKRARKAGKMGPETVGQPEGDAQNLRRRLATSTAQTPPPPPPHRHARAGGHPRLRPMVGKPGRDPLRALSADTWTPGRAGGDDAFGDRAGAGSAGGTGKEGRGNGAGGRGAAQDDARNLRHLMAPSKPVQTPAATPRHARAGGHPRVLVSTFGNPNPQGIAGGHMDPRSGRR